MNKLNSEVLSSDSDSDSDSSGSVELLMETNNLLKGEALGFKQSVIKDVEIATLQSLWNVSSTGNEDGVILEPCETRENVCMSRPKGVNPEWFYFYVGVVEELNIQFPFTDFETDILRKMNVAPSQLRPNSWGFIRAF